MGYNIYREYLADLMDVDIEQLNITLYKNNRKEYYDKRIIKKSNGKDRTIHSVKQPLKILQKKLHKLLKENCEPSMFCHGFVEGKNIISNAKYHTRKKLVIAVDIKDFFPSITFARVTGMFQGPGFKLPRTMAHTIAQITCLPDENGSLPQGGVTSPIISNLICRKLDSRLFGLAKKNKMHFTRYADDITFSTNKETDISNFLGQVYNIIEEEGFEVNKNKTKVMFPWNRQVVTGIIVNDGLNVNRKYIRNLRATLHNIEETSVYAQIVRNKFDDDRNSRLGLKHKPGNKKVFITKKGDEIDVNTAKTKFLNHLRGKINFVGQVVKANDYENNEKYKKRYQRYKKLEQRLNRIRHVDKIKGYDAVTFRKNLQEIENLPTDKKDIDEYISDKRTEDPRYFVNQFKLDGKKPDSINKCLNKLKKLHLIKIDRECVNTIFKNFRDSENAFWGKFIHQSSITKKEFNDYYDLFREKYRYKLPQDFSKLLLKSLEKAAGYLKDNKQYNFWENDKCRNSLILPLKQKIRFESGHPDECSILKDEIKKVKKEILNVSKYKNKKVDIMSCPNIVDTFYAA